jgi:tetratricopeptide (TPR) repeat protein
LPRGGGAQVLVTSNAHAWRGVAEPVEIRLWPKEIGADYLINRTGRTSERAAAEALSEVLGGLPLAHEQAAAYCERLGISLGEYQKRFEASPQRLLNDARHAPAEYHDGRTVENTFALAIDEAAKLHPAAELLIMHAAMLAPEPIPLYFFSEAREKFGEPLASALTGDGLDEAVAALRFFALIDREMIVDEHAPSVTTDTIRLHRLVRQTAKARLDGSARERMLPTLVKAMAGLYPPDVYDDPKAWSRARRLDPIALPLVSDDVTSPAGIEWETAVLLNRLAFYRYGPLTSYAHAEKLFERALAIREKHLGSEHPDTATSLNNLALVLRFRGDTARARRLLQRSLAIRKKVLGRNHFETAWSLHNLARILRVRGNLAAARRLCQRALLICETAPDTPLLYLAASINQLGRILHEQADMAGAQPLYERALAIWEQVRGTEHPNANLARCNLARLMLSTDRPEQALSFGQSALSIDDKALGRDHPWTKGSARVTADALAALGRADEATALRARYGLTDDGK